MCCRACSGYELCKDKAQLRDDCCPQCKYFESCMEAPEEEQLNSKTNLSKKRYVKK